MKFIATLHRWRSNQRALTVRLLLISLALMIGSAQSQEPAPTPTKGDEGNQTQAAKGKQKAKQDQHGTANSPLVVDVLRPKKSEVEAAQDTKDREDKSTEARFSFWFNILLVLFNGILAVTTVLLWLVTGRAANAAKKSADAAERSVEIIRKQTQAEVGPSASKLEFPNGIPTTTVIIQNFGPTSARSLVHIGGLAFREYPLQGSIWPDELPSVHSEAILGANSTLGHSTQAPSPLTESQKAKIADETMTLYVYGRITYNDVFEARHITEYLYVWKNIPGAPQGILAAYPTGNKAK